MSFDMNILEQYNDKINGLLQSFDRIIINGYILALQNPRLFLFYLISNDIKLVDFKSFAENQTSSLCTHIEQFIKDNGVSLTYLPSARENKDTLARNVFKQNPNKTGLIAAFSTVEVCRTMTVISNHDSKKLETASRNTKCKHYYLYFNDVEFGWMFIKIQTWFPYNVQVYMNGREYLSRLYSKNNLSFQMYHNSFSYLEDFEKAQAIADGILNEKISSSLDGMIDKINNLLPNIKEKMNHSYYWCIDQCEFAADINFKDKDTLTKIYKKLVETSYFSFNCQDIYSFFGRKIEYINRFNGELTSDLRNRQQGYRIKFKMNKNQIKMYDKGNNLRIEVTINNPKEFKVLKNIEHDDETVKKWLPMGKSIANLYRYAEISKSIIKRFIDSLPVVDDEQLSLNELKDVSIRKEVNGRYYSAFNLLNEDTLQLFNAVADGKYIIKGFSNKDIRKEIFKEESEDKKNINKTTRLFGKLKAHKIIKKVNHKNRYYLTVQGRKIITSLMTYTNREVLS